MLTCVDLEREGLWQTSRCDDRCHEAGSLRQTVLPDGRIAETCCFAQWHLIQHLHLPWPTYEVGDRVWFMMVTTRYEAIVTAVYPRESDGDDLYPGESYYGLAVFWPDGREISTSVYGREIGGRL